MTQEAIPSLELLATLYRERFHRYVRVAEAICGDPHLARDAVQDAFANAIRGRTDFRGEASIESWLWRCVVNAAHRATGSGAERLVLDSQPAAYETTTNGRRLDADERLRAALATLTNRQREILFLRYYADLDYRKIAETLGITTGTVGAALHAAQAALRRQLEVPR